MPDDVTDAIGIIRELGEAGLLRTAGCGTPESQAPSDAVRMLGALRRAGLLADPGGGAAPGGGAPAGAGPAGGAAPGAEAVVPKGPEVGDTLWVVGIFAVDKQITADEGTILTLRSAERGKNPVQYWVALCEFPPNDERILEEIDKVLASTKPSAFLVNVDVLDVRVAGPPAWVFDARLNRVQSIYHTPRIPFRREPGGSEEY